MCTPRYLVTDPASAEMIKYASSAFLATKITVHREIATSAKPSTPMCARLRSVWDTTRIGFQFLHPGPGFGGSCFPKDTAALIYTVAARRATTSSCSTAWWA